MFFFFNYEGTRAGRPDGASFVDVPNPALFRGDFSSLLRPDLIAGTNFQVGTIFQPGTVTKNSAGNITGGTPFPGNVIPASLFAKNTPAFLKIINFCRTPEARPCPASRMCSGFPIRTPTRLRKTARFCASITTSTPRPTSFSAGPTMPRTRTRAVGIFATNTYPVFPEYRKKPGASWSWNLISTITPTMTNEAIFTYNHLTQIVDVVPGTDTSTYDRDKLGFTFKELYPAANVDNKFPRFTAGSLNFSNFAAGWLSEGKTYAITDNLTKIVGAHTLKAGVYWNRNANVPAARLDGCHQYQLQPEPR